MSEDVDLTHLAQAMERFLGERTGGVFVKNDGPHIPLLHQLTELLSAGGSVKHRAELLPVGWIALDGIQPVQERSLVDEGGVDIARQIALTAAAGEGQIQDGPGHPDALFGFMPFPMAFGCPDSGAGQLPKFPAIANADIASWFDTTSASDGKAALQHTFYIFV